VTAYVENISNGVNSMELKRADSGTNVTLVEPFDEVVFDRTSNQNGLRCVALSQLCADLLTGPGRDPAEGEELLTKLDSWEFAPPNGKRPTR
jgi:hypothetical protein